MNYPEYVKIDGIQYDINTDFRYALKCEEVANNPNIDDYERAFAIIYLLFGDKGLDATQHHEKLLQLGRKYLACGKKIEENQKEEEPDMDFQEDWDYIETSFQSDYNIDLSDKKMHWWKFFNLLNGLSTSELGNCCVLNRVRNLRNYDVSEIKDEKLRKQIIEAKKSVALHKKQKNILSHKQSQSAIEFLKHFRKE